MDTITTPQRAAGILAAFADHDFHQLVEALEPDATMHALLPSGPRQWAGAATIGAAFQQWFGDTESYEVLDTGVDRIGALLALRWRLRVRATRLGDDAMVVEQHAYARTGPTGRVAHLALLCSGFWAQHDDAG